MKKILIYVLAFFITSSLRACEPEEPVCFPCQKHSTSAFIGKPASQNAILELGMTNYFRYDTMHDACSYFLDIFPFFFVSTNAKELGDYFSPNGLPSIFIEDNNTSTISSPWIDITAPGQKFQSVLSLHPVRKEAGLGLSFFTHFDYFATPESQWPSSLWLALFMPLQWVQHSLALEQILNVSDGATPFSSPIQAFNNPTWCFGKLACQPKSSFGIADILLKVGYDVLYYCRSHLGFYGCAFIPTFHGMQSHYLFEPTIGALGHAGLGFGMNTDWCLWQNENYAFLQWMADIRYAYFFARDETRSTDLFFNGDWSRYLLVAQEGNLEQPLPGINYFTQSISIIPANTFNIWTAFNLEWCNFNFEFGYNFWWRQEERAKHFKDPNVVIYDIQGTPGSRTSSSTATIATGAPGIDAPANDIFPILITADNFFVNSATIPTIIINSFYASLGGTIHACDYQMLLSAGGYYDLSYRNTSCSGWGGWLKFSVEL